MRVDRTLMTDADFVDYLEMLVKSFRAKGHHDCAASLNYWIREYKNDQKLALDGKRNKTEKD